jgi:hypothetical protein
MTNLVPVDRTNMFNVLKVDTWPLYQVDKKFQKSYDEICYSTAIDYWNKHDDISVLWSGGLDSTCVAISFIETKPIGKKLTLIGSKESIDEYPSFYEQHKNLIKIDSNIEFWSRFVVHQNKTMYVTGDIGDQIFGGCIDEFGDKKTDNWQNFVNYEDVFRQSKMHKEHLQKEWTTKEKNDFILTMEKFNSQAPFPIVTLFDFVWWLTFTTRYNGAANNMTNLATEVIKSDKAAIGTYSCFFHNHDFEQWSMLNHDLKYPGGQETYKQPIKDFIARYNNDMDFLINKRKEKSTPRLLENEEWFSDWRRNEEVNYYIIMSDGTLYNSKNEIPFELMTSLLTFLD